MASAPEGQDTEDHVSLKRKLYVASLLRILNNTITLNC